jgi:hypothetical protein
MSALSTADPNSARAHARAQAGTRAEAMPTIPASAAKGLGPHPVSTRPAAATAAAI